MPINSKTATAAIALMIAAGAYPIAGIAQDDTTSADQNDSVQVEVIESDDNADVTPGTETDADAADRTGDDTETTARDGKSDNVDSDQDSTSSDDAVGGDTTTSTDDSTSTDTTTSTDDSSSSDQDSTTSSSDLDADQSATSGDELGDGTDSTTGSDSSAETTTGTATVTETDESTTGDELDSVQSDEVDQAVIDDQPAVSEGMLMETQDDNQWLSSDLTSKNVENPQGDKIGSVGGIIFSDDGPEGVIVEVGGFLGIGQKNVALRWSELSITDDAIIVDATKEELKDAPEFVSLEDQRRESEAMEFDDSAPMGTGGIDGEPAVDGGLGTPEQDTVQ